MSSWLSQTSHSSGIDVAMAGMAVRAVEAPESSDEEGDGEHSTNEPDTVAAMTVSEEVDSEVGSAISTATDITDSRIFSDIGYLKYPVADELRFELVKRGAEPLQHTDDPFEVVNGRSLTSSWFTCILQNQKTVPRTWLLCSPSKGCAFCFCCLLFKADGQEHGSFGCADGFRTWKKLNLRVYEHERSRRHRAAFIQWKELEQHLRQNTIIDAGLQAQITAEIQRWRDVLDRILHTVKLRATQNLPLRGHRESLQQSQNPENFLAVIEADSPIRYCGCAAFGLRCFQPEICVVFVSRYSERVH